MHNYSFSFYIFNKKTLLLYIITLILHQESLTWVYVGLQSPHDMSTEYDSQDVDERGEGSSHVSWH
jgi:hypothetical protein